MQVFIDAIMEKHAGMLGNLWGKIPMVKKLRQVVTTPSFKTKKVLGTVALASAPTAYAGYQLAKVPEPVHQNTVPGIPPAYQ